jgi:hypothetical protein
MAEVKAVMDMVMKNNNAVPATLPTKNVIIVRGAESTCNVTIQAIEKEFG